MKLLLTATFILAGAIVGTAQVAAGGSYTLDKSVIAAGGGVSSGMGGTVYTVQGTAGQSAAGAISYGGSYVLKNGFWTAAPLGTTASEVAVSGRVLTTGGKGLMNARVLITDGKGQTWSVQTSAFGNFHLDGLTAGQTVIIAVSSKRYTFAPQVLTLTDSISGLTLTAQ